MGLDIFFKEDAQRILLAIDESNRAACRLRDNAEVRIYRMGFEAAIRAAATGFGVTLPNVRGPFIVEIPDAFKMLEVK